jgi:CheY-like chemotaxis protein
MLLVRLIGEDIELAIHTHPDLHTVRVDPVQAEQIILNLAINSRDAMPEGGTLTFSTECKLLDKGYCRKQPYELSPGRYCEICVTDSGIGMNAEAKKHLFEPFFTTKEKGKGTGMGLPAVYGIVKSHKGAINVYSEPGRGTTVKIYLPASGAAGEPEDSKDHSPSVRASAKRLNILFVDDEKIIREMVKEMLEFLGHTVAECENGRKAVEYYRTSWESVDVVILDMIMPEMGGKEAFIAMRGINPRIKAVLSSGYSIDGEAQQILSEGVLGFIQKPFRTDALVDILSRVMKA